MGITNIIPPFMASAAGVFRVRTTPVFLAKNGPLHQVFNSYSSSLQIS